MGSTPQALDCYIGGQAEIWNPTEQYLYVGEVSEVCVSSEDILEINFKWCARHMGFPPDTWWVMADTYEEHYYAIDLTLCTGGDIRDDRTELAVPSVGEMIVLYPAGDCRLDPMRVLGLQVA